jgi:hypothetical protein
VEIEDGRISNAVRWQLMVDVDEAVWFRNDRNGIVLLSVFLVERGCLRLYVCEVAQQLCCRPCRTNKKGKILGQLLSLLMGDAGPFVRSRRPYLELAGSVALVVATLSSLRKNYLTKNRVATTKAGFVF